MSDRYRRLVELTNGTTGEQFRSAFRDDADSWGALYVRSGIATTALASGVVITLETGVARNPRSSSRAVSACSRR